MLPRIIRQTQRRSLRSATAASSLSSRSPLNATAVRSSSSSTANLSPLLSQTTSRISPSSRTVLSSSRDTSTDRIEQQFSWLSEIPQSASRSFHQSSRDTQSSAFASLSTPSETAEHEPYEPSARTYGDADEVDGPIAGPSSRAVEHRLRRAGRWHSDRQMNEALDEDDDSPFERFWDQQGVSADLESPFGSRSNPWSQSSDLAESLESGTSMTEEVSIPSLPRRREALDSSTSRLRSSSSASALDHGRSRIVLPSPLPEDQPTTPAQSDLYPSTSLMDSLSLISVCLRRPETTSRAYYLFQSLLREHKAGRVGFPDAEVWGSVIEGAGALATKPETPRRMNAKVARKAAEDVEMWRKRAHGLVEEWEQARGGMDMRNGGDKVYQGWVRGLLHSDSPLTPVLPYFDSGSLTLLDLVPAFKATEIPVLCDAFRDLAADHNHSEILEEIKNLKHREEERIEAAARKSRTVPEVRPILSKTPYPTTVTDRITHAGITADDTALPRFAITNLRATLRTMLGDEPPLRRQEVLEAASLAAARAELEHAAATIREQGLKDVEEAQRLGSQQLQAWMWQWSQALMKKLEIEMSKLKDRVEHHNKWLETRGNKGLEVTTERKTSKTEELDLYLYLDLLSTEKLALVTIFEIIRLAGSGGVSDGMKTLRGLVSVGKAVETEYRADTLQLLLGKEAFDTHESTQKKERSIETMWRRLVPGTQNNMAVNTIVDKIKRGEDVFSDDVVQSYGNVFAPDWSTSKHLAIGSFLVSHLVDVAKITRTVTDEDGTVHSEEHPAFSHALEYVRGQRQGVIKLNPAVVSLLAKDQIASVAHPKHLPMLVPPRPWTSYNQGGYLFHRVPFMRLKESIEQSSYLKLASQSGQLDSVYRGIDVLSSTPWHINDKVFDVCLKVWNEGTGIADIPPAEHLANYKIPLKPGKSDPPEIRSKYIMDLKAVKLQMQKDHGERCKFNYTLEIARSYLNDTFYIPHNIDFRGRAYPIPPHLSPVGDDLCRGLLTFAEKKRLGNHGLRWLRIHLANVFGYDKASFSERVKFAEEHWEDIADSAERPLEGRRWWLKAEDPWQCLATCFEINEAMKLENPEDFESSIPVHQDGTCNGMQHYAALGGDVQGAKAVNLDYGDRPSDVYTQIADLVIKNVDADAEKGNQVALLLQGKITRKVVKQTVMTTVYGVTTIGAKDQIAKQLRDRGDIPAEKLHSVALYLAKGVLGCIGDLFAGAKAIQDWLTVCARLISKSIPTERAEAATQALTKKSGKNIVPVVNSSGQKVSRLQREFMTSVIWTTPLGLPVIQPYRKQLRKQVKTALQTVFISDPNVVAEVSPQKQASAMPPNFIHSLDATHMLLCATKCREQGITFASVHDSYWTHASTVNELSINIRDTFIDLHQRDIIGDLRAEFLERYAEHRVLALSARNILLRVKSAKKEKTTSTRRDDADDAEPETLEESEATVPDVEIDPASGKTHLRIAGESVPAEQINGKWFVKLVDVVPLCPERGSFDVNRIRLSPYFFS